ncbi:hypothetical protein [Actinomadura kijaniata]|uniref:hypothetical protein n=1 Tax=Actinomadura kijaniata TaxID=46161 RepID=UPI0012FA24BB|nr:hypothetical protein [Actinomadura kijaniata]
MNRTTRSLLKAAVLAPAAVLLAVGAAPAHAEVADGLSQRALAPVQAHQAAAADCVSGLMSRAMDGTGLRTRGGAARCPVEEITSLAGLDRVTGLTGTVEPPLRAGANHRRAGTDGVDRLVNDLEGTVRAPLPREASDVLTETKAVLPEAKAVLPEARGVLAEARGALSENEQGMRRANPPVPGGDALGSVADTVNPAVTDLVNPVLHDLGPGRSAPANGRVAGPEPLRQLLGGLLGEPPHSVSIDSRRRLANDPINDITGSLTAPVTSQLNNAVGGGNPALPALPVPGLPGLPGQG